MSQTCYYLFLVSAVIALLGRWQGLQIDQSVVSVGRSVGWGQDGPLPRSLESLDCLFTNTQMKQMVRQIFTLDQHLTLVVK